LRILAAIGKHWKIITIKTSKYLFTHGKTSLMVSKSILDNQDLGNFIMVVKTISILWSLIFPSPVPMVLKFWKVKYLVLIKVVLIR
jgi:hypothetical protein